MLWLYFPSISLSSLRDPEDHTFLLGFREFYTYYRSLVPKNKKQACEFKPMRLVKVRGTKVDCYSEHINVLF